MKLAAAFNQGGTPTINVINQATIPLGFNLDDFIIASQHFLDKLFAPVWGYNAKLVRASEPTSNAWTIVFLDDADVARALGYHDLTVGGQPVSKVFVKTILSVDQKVSTTFVHEMCEMMIDPGAQLWAMGPGNMMYAYETADACEEDEFTFEGFVMSDFVYPAFFEYWHQPGSVKFDYLGKIARPFETRPGGYQVVMKRGKVHQIFGSEEKAARFALEDRRLHRSEYRACDKG